MSVVEVKLPKDVGHAIELAVAAGHASSADDYVAHALREYLSATDHYAAEARLGIEEIATGTFKLVDDLDDWSIDNLERARATLENKATGN